MIVVKLQGGLGNQLFQYALGRKLSIIRNRELFIDRSNYKILNLKRIFLLDRFNVTFNTLKTEIKDYKWIIEEKIEDKKDIFDFEEKVVLNGYWQSEEYFKDVSAVIRKEFTLKKPLSSKYLKLSGKINSCNSIALHIRRGDYVNNSFYHQCSPNYYHKAICYLMDKVSNPFFFIFSDDIKWCKSNLRLEAPHYFVSPSNRWNCYKDLVLMSNCRHFIMANSSFSWWGAWLSKNPDKLVVAPQKWFGNQNMNINDIVPSEWIRL